MTRLIEKFSKSIKVLNDYRNLYHAESSSTEQYKVANAINDILPEFCRLIESDAEPVVRCKDCKYHIEHKYSPTFYKCKQVSFLKGRLVSSKFGCVLGAKMDEEQECEI